MDSAHRVRAVLSHLVSVVSFSLGEPARAQIVLEESTIGIFTTHLLREHVHCSIPSDENKHMYGRLNYANQ